MSEPPHDPSDPRPDPSAGHQPQYGQPPAYGRQPSYGEQGQQPSYGAPGQYGPPGPYAQGPYAQGPYAQGPYAQGQYGAPGQYGVPGRYDPPGGPPRATITLGSLLGARARRRPEARLSSALAGAGAALAIVGAYVWSVGYFAAGFGIDFDSSSSTSLGRPSVHGEGRRFLGFGVFLALTLLGYAVVVLRRRGPLATAGTVLSAFALPGALGFVFLDISGTFTSGALPINVDAVYLISIAAWLISYVAVPGARGRAVYLAAAAVALPTYIAFKTSGNASLRTGASVFSGDGLGGGSGGGSSTHTGTVAAVTLAFGLVYYLLAALLDRAGRGGIAIALLYPAFVATAAGIALAANDFGQIGTGVTLVVVGLLVSLYGGRFGRRFTTWVWAAAAALGVVVIVAKLGTDRYTAIGLILLGVGLALAAVTHVLPPALHEQPDVVEQEAAPAA